MLFDLRGSGRRRVIKVVYVSLALLMGGGLVLFGIGGEVSGGLVDAITQGGGGDDGGDRLRDREEQLVRQTTANPDNAVAWAELARTRSQLAGQGDNFDPQEGRYTEEGLAELREAGAAWQRHLATAGEEPDARVATLMVQSYAALNDLDEAVRAQEIVAEARDAPGPYSQLAQLAYQAGQIRKGDLARDRALELTEPDLRESLRGQLDAIRQQFAPATQTPTPTPDEG